MCWSTGWSVDIVDYHWSITRPWLERHQHPFFVSRSSPQDSLWAQLQCVDERLESRLRFFLSSAILSASSHSFSISLVWHSNPYRWIFIKEVLKIVYMIIAVNLRLYLLRPSAHLVPKILRWTTDNKLLSQKICTLYMYIRISNTTFDTEKRPIYSIKKRYAGGITGRIL